MVATASSVIAILVRRRASACARGSAEIEISRATWRALSKLVSTR